MNTEIDLDPKNFTNMIPLANESAAMDFLLAVKNGIRNYAMALNEVITPEARMTVRNQLEESIDMHDKLTGLMIQKGWLHPYDVNKQFQLDIKTANATAAIAEMKLFTDRRIAVIAEFDTPQQPQQEH